YHKKVIIGFQHVEHRCTDTFLCSGHLCLPCGRCAAFRVFCWPAEMVDIEQVEFDLIWVVDRCCVLSVVVRGDDGFMGFSTRDEAGCTWCEVFNCFGSYGAPR